MTKQELVKSLLETGEFTSMQLCRWCRTPDARKIISVLRADYKNGHGGADVQDRWVYRDGTRHKLYWISQSLTTKAKGGDQ